MLIRLTTAALLALAFTAAPAQADGARSTYCVGHWGLGACTTTWRHWEPKEAEAPTEKELAEARERDKNWLARCKPVVQQDSYGVPRYVYAAAGCEYGRIQ